MVVEPENHEDGLDKDGSKAEFDELPSRILRANNDVSCSKFQNQSLTQTIYKMTQFKMPCGMYD